MSKYHLVGSSYMQANTWAFSQKLKRDEWIYVVDPTMLAGLRGLKIIFLEGWTECRSRKEIEQTQVFAREAERLGEPVFDERVAARDFIEKLEAQMLALDGECSRLRSVVCSLTAQRIKLAAKHKDCVAALQPDLFIQ